jgi:hypothetical protein
VIDPGGRGADKTQPTAFNQSGVDARHRAHQQHLGISENLGVEFTAVKQSQLALRGKVRRDGVDFAVGKDFQGTALGGA